MELCLAGLFFLVRDTENRASCTPQVVIIIVAMVFTALFHCSLSRPGSRWFWYPKWSKQLSMAETVAIKTAPEPDPALTSTCPVLWVPEDDLGISADEIYHARKSGIVISNNGACLERGKLRLRGPPPSPPKVR
jgi:hypothetical protein